jgi:hypothetical protein
MNHLHVRPKETSDPPPQAIVQELLRRPLVPALQQELRPSVARRVATLERHTPEIIGAARRAGTEIEYLGINPLFAEARLYNGVQTDWVLAPADKHEAVVVPRHARQALQRLIAADIDFPVIYVAHEVPKEHTEHLRPAVDQGHIVLDRAEAAALVGPVPPPAAAVELGDRLAERSTQVVNAARRAVSIAGQTALGIVAAPVALVGGALASLGNLDPIVLGAIPALSARPGQPAAWYVLARWDW